MWAAMSTPRVRHIRPGRRSALGGGADGIYIAAADKTLAYDTKHAAGNPITARQLAKLEAKSIKTGKNPRNLKQAPTAQVAKLLTMLVEYSTTANDDFTGVMVTDSTDTVTRSCGLGNVQNGPTNNTIPNPATMAHEDNNSMWVADFNQEHYNKMLYTSTGITERIRPDLTGPDGKPGIDISGLTMRNMYLENNLRHPNRLTMCNTPVDLGRVDLPAYVLATVEDHIVPWRSAYRTTGLFSGDTRFVLGASGHIAGVINPASKNKRSYWVSANRCDDPATWLASAAEKPGSWWNDWIAWLKPRAEEQLPARKQLGSNLYPPGESAPGRYVKEKAT